MSKQIGNKKSLGSVRSVASRFRWAVLLSLLLLPLAKEAHAAGIAPFSFGNPINAPDIQTFIRDVLTIAVTIGTPIAVLAIMYSGFLLVTARGNPQQLAQGKKALLFSVIGTALLLGAWVIAQAVKGTIDNITS